MKIIATLCRGRDLKPGDLFSKYGPTYWDGGYDPRSIGESVYVRTDVSADVAGDADRKIFKIDIVRDEAPLAPLLVESEAFPAVGVPPGITYFRVGACNCGALDCDTVRLLLFRPTLWILEGTENDVVATANLPTEAIPQVIAHLRHLYHEKGCLKGEPKEPTLQ